MTDAAPSFKIDSSLKTRLISAALFAPAVLVVIFFDGLGFALMLAAAAGIATREWADMLARAGAFPKGFSLLAAVVAALAILVSHMLGLGIPGCVFALSLAFLLLAYNYAYHGPDLKLFFAGFFYIFAALAVMLWLREEVVNGLFHFLTLLFIVWASDSFAYVFGRLIGGPKLAPAISPKKTWAGLIGGSVGAGGVAALMTLPIFSFGEPRALAGVSTYFALGALLSVVGQAGDLLVSLYKRRFGVKDTGTLIPGHGGILDRIDALLLVALVFGAYVAVMV